MNPMTLTVKVMIENIAYINILITDIKLEWCLSGCFLVFKQEWHAYFIMYFSS